MAIDLFTDLFAVATIRDKKPVQVLGGNSIRTAVDQLEARGKFPYKRANTAQQAASQCSFLIIFLFLFTFYAGAVLSYQRFPLLFF